MLPQEIAIFKTWFAVNGDKYTSVDFNVRVGVGYDPGAQYLAAVRTSVIANSKKRIDALARSGQAATIIEVKFRATPLVIGQILCYNLLWRRENVDGPEPDMIVLCSQTDADTMYCAVGLGIEVIAVVTDFTGVKVQKIG
jgi:hypothetical protein